MGHTVPFISGKSCAFFASAPLPPMGMLIFPPSEHNFRLSTCTSGTFIKSVHARATKKKSEL